MEFHLTSIDEVNGIRRLAFSCLAADGSRRNVTVTTDVSLLRTHEIRLQELPLLCRQLLAGLPADDLNGSVSFPQDQMIAFQLASKTATERKPPKKRPAAPNSGFAWRNSRI